MTAIDLVNFLDFCSRLRYKDIEIRSGQEKARAAFLSGFSGDLSTSARERGSFRRQADEKRYCYTYRIGAVGLCSSC